MDMDGVMINSRDNGKRMEGKVAIVWSKRELVKADTDRQASHGHIHRYREFLLGYDSRGI
jgi:hypothetical protein